MYDFPRTLWDELENEFNLRSDYSGRAMYGNTCIGITGDTSDLLKFIARVATWNFEANEDPNSPEGIELVEDLARSARSDSMGYDTIFYFPGVELENEGPTETWLDVNPG